MSVVPKLNLRKIGITPNVANQRSYNSSMNGPSATRPYAPPPRLQAKLDSRPPPVKKPPPVAVKKASALMPRSTAPGPASRSKAKSAAVQPVRKQPVARSSASLQLFSTSSKGSSSRTSSASFAQQPSNHRAAKPAYFSRKVPPPSATGDTNGQFGPGFKPAPKGVPTYHSRVLYDAQMDHHRRRISSAKASVDTRPPSSMTKSTLGRQRHKSRKAAATKDPLPFQETVYERKAPETHIPIWEKMKKQPRKRVKDEEDLSVVSSVTSGVEITEDSEALMYSTDSTVGEPNYELAQSIWADTKLSGGLNQVVRLGATRRPRSRSESPHSQSSRSQSQSSDRTLTPMKSGEYAMEYDDSFEESNWEDDNDGSYDSDAHDSNAQSIKSTTNRNIRREKVQRLSDTDQLRGSSTNRGGISKIEDSGRFVETDSDREVLNTSRKKLDHPRTRSSTSSRNSNRHSVASGARSVAWSNITMDDESDSSEDEDMKYTEFVAEVTQDVLKTEVFSERALRQKFENHIQRRAGDLDETRMREVLKLLEGDLALHDET